MKNSVLPLALALCTALPATPAAAQRSGFIIGFGLGPGWMRSGFSVPQLAISDSESSVGVATDFHIGGVLGEVELYFASHANLRGTDASGASFIGTGMSGIGVTYPLNSRMAVRGVVGQARETLFMSDGGTLDAWDGLGLIVGGRYGLSDRWAAALDLGYASWSSGGSPSSEGDVWSLDLTLNVMSH